MEETFMLKDVREVPLWDRYWNGHFTHITHYTTLEIPPNLQPVIRESSIPLPLYDRAEDLANGIWTINIPLSAFSNDKQFFLAQIHPNLTRIN
ncbi:hypothetical protein GF362_00480 [Candidatus Dojkabacteria bacterium]|nr:hypothetical protein [Candidatus Dojkabacteria bacterium]